MAAKKQVATKTTRGPMIEGRLDIASSARMRRAAHIRSDAADPKINAPTRLPILACPPKAPRMLTTAMSAAQQPKNLAIVDLYSAPKRGPDSDWLLMQSKYPGPLTELLSEASEPQLPRFADAASPLQRCFRLVRSGLASRVRKKPPEGGRVVPVLGPGSGPGQRKS